MFKTKYTISEKLGGFIMVMSVVLGLTTACLYQWKKNFDESLRNLVIEFSEVQAEYEITLGTVDRWSRQLAMLDDMMQEAGTVWTPVPTRKPKQ